MDEVGAFRKNMQFYLPAAYPATWSVQMTPRVSYLPHPLQVKRHLDDFRVPEAPFAKNSWGREEELRLKMKRDQDLLNWVNAIERNFLLFK